MLKDESNSKKIKRISFKKFFVIAIIAFVAIASAITVYNVVMTWIVVSPEVRITLEDPLNDTTINTNTTTFNWSGIGGETGNLYYVWYADLNSSFTSPYRRAIDVDINETYDCNPLPDGKWYWRIEATDGGTRINVSETFVLNVVTNATNNNSYLSDGAVDPVVGSTSAIFEYTVNFTDADNHSATYVRIYIDDIMYSMTETNASDTNTTDGKQYNYSTTLSTGWHNYSFTCSDGIGVNYTDVYDNPFVNDQLTIYSPYPTNNSINISLTPTCHISVTDPEGDDINVTFASNYTGAWVNYQTNYTVNNGTYYWAFTGASSYGTTYYWRVYADDDTYNISRAYIFTTLEMQIISDISPENGATYICPCCDGMCFNITNEEGHNMNITIYRNDTQFTDFYVVNKYINVSNGRYCFCLDGHINDSIYYPMQFDTTYYWYINYTDIVTDTSNNSEVFSFTTVADPDYCNSLGSGMIFIKQNLFWFFLIAVLIILVLVVLKNKNKLFFKF